MKKLIPLLICSHFFAQAMQAQINCTTPKKLNICPSVYLAGQTNAGMVDDAPIPCNITGEDLLYQIMAPNGANALFVSILNATGPMQLALEHDSCGNGVCNIQSVPAGNSNIAFNVTANAYYYLWIDAAGTVVFDLSVGGDTGTVFINIPNTQGNLQFNSSSCGVPPFIAAKPFFQVTYNNIIQTNPMTLAPLSIPGTMCISAYFKNTTGDEGVKKFIFHFTPGGYLAVSPAPSIIPGFYNTGNWISGQTGNDWIFSFVDSAGTGRGDFTGSPDSCLRYNFCF